MEYCCNSISEARSRHPNKKKYGSEYNDKKRCLASNDYSCL